MVVNNHCTVGQGQNYFYTPSKKATIPEVVMGQ